MSSHVAVGELPPTDHVARVLLKRGARDQALALLRAAIQRDPGEKACAALLRAVEARPEASVYGPDLPLGLDLVEAYMRSGMFVEALAVLEGTGLGAEPTAAARTRVLRQLLAPPPDDSDPQLREMDRHVRTGGASVALSMLDARAEVLPEWARHRRALLQELLIDTAQPASRISTVSGAPTALGAALEASLRTRDLRAVLSAARAYGAAHPEDGDVAGALVALERLVDAMAEVSGDMTSTVLRTQPMTGHHVALFQLRMANLEVAERMFRKLVIDEPLDEVARQRLEDIQTVRAALSRSTPSELPLTLPSVAPAGPPNVDPLLETMSVSREDLELAGGDSRPVLTAVVLSPVEDDPDTVSTAVGRPSMEVTKPVHLSPLPRSLPGGGGGSTEAADAWEEEGSTDIGQPEHHAELLLKQGLADHALRIYESLVVRFPDEGAYALRLHEIRAILERQRAARASTESIVSESIEGESNVQEGMRQGPTASGPIWIGPLADDSTDEPRQSGVLPAAADDEVSGFGRTPAAGSGRPPLPSWEDDATTVEPVSDVSAEVALSPPGESDRHGAEGRDSGTASSVATAPLAAESAVVQVRRIIAVR